MIGSEKEIEQIEVPKKLIDTLPNVTKVPETKESMDYEIYEADELGETPEMTVERDDVSTFITDSGYF